MGNTPTNAPCRARTYDPAVNGAGYQSCPEQVSVSIQPAACSTIELKGQTGNSGFEPLQTGSKPVELPLF